MPDGVERTGEEARETVGLDEDEVTVFDGGEIVASRFVEDEFGEGSKGIAADERKGRIASGCGMAIVRMVSGRGILSKG